MRLAPAIVATMLAAVTAHSATFELVSKRSDGAAPTFYSDGSNQPAITADGRYVVFTASATNLVTPDAAGSQIYLRDRAAGTTELVSVSTTGGAGNSSSSSPSISDDGCRVVFMSFASNLVVSDANATQDVFVRNRCAQAATTSLVSVSSAGTQGNAESREGRISGDGSTVAFISYATNLASLTGAGTACLFRRNLNASTTSAITTAAGKCIDSAVPDLSYTGSRVAFWAYFEPGTSNVTNGVWQIYLYDFGAAPASQPTVISTSAGGAPQLVGGEGASTITEPAISPDGGYVAFRSRGGGLVAGIVGAVSHVYLKEIATNLTVLVSVDSAGNPGNGDSSGSGQGYRPGLSEFGGTVTYLTNATNLAPETGGFFPNVVAHNPRTGTTVGFTASQTLGGRPGISARGNLIAAYSGSHLDAAYASRGMFVFAGLVPRLGNISTRMQVLTGDDVMIGGFVVGGFTTKRVAVVATGPSLAAFGITNPLANPTLTLVRSSDQATIATNDNWQSAANQAELTAAGFAPSNAQEAAILVDLAPGAYTAIVSGVGGGTGVSVIGVYEVDRPQTPLVNISTRGRVLTGDDVMIGGFIVNGSVPQTLAIVATGPSLAAFGITSPLANPTITLVRSSDQAVLGSNDDWQADANAAQLQTAGFAPSNALESGLLVTLPPGAYTVIVQGVGGGTGVAVIGVYAVN